MQTLVIKAEDFENIVDHCLQEKPNEACGILGGIKENDKGIVKKVYLMENSEKSPELYFMEPEEQFEVFKDIRENGVELISIFHSHPHSKAIPSSKDIEMANYPDAIYTIISLKDSQINLRSYLIDKEFEEFEEIMVERIDHK